MAVQRASVAEVRREVAEVRESSQRIERRVDDHAEKIADLRESQARTDGQVTHLVRAYERAATVATTQVLTDLEVKKADALALIEDRALERKHRRAIVRELLLKTITLAMGGGSVIYAILRSGC